MPTLNTVDAEGLGDINGGGDCQSEQGSIQFLRTFGTELDECHHFGEQSFSTSSPLWKLLPIRQNRVEIIEGALTRYSATL